MQGFGKYTWGKGKKQYMGQWKQNMMEGKGTFLWNNGQKFVGYYK